MPHRQMLHEVDPRVKLLDGLDDVVSDIEVPNNFLLCAVYIRPEQTKSKLILIDSTRDEDKFQGKVVLVLKLGPTACSDPTGDWQWFDRPVEPGDWLVFRASDGLGMSIGDNGVMCRMFEDKNIVARITHPDQVY